MSRMVPKYQTMLERELERILRRLESELPLSEEYKDTLAIAERLNDMVEEDKTSYLSKDTIATIGANLLGLFMIIKHERVNVITSKALTFVPRLRI